MALRKVVKLDENGVELKDEQGQYIFEEIEIEDATPTIEDSIIPIEDPTIVEGTPEFDNSDSQKDEEIQKLIEENSSLKEEIAKLKKQLNLEDPIPNNGAHPGSAEPSNYSSLGVNLKSLKG